MFHSLGNLLLKLSEKMLSDSGADSKPVQPAIATKTDWNFVRTVLDERYSNAHS
jgi:hypothetical protein